MATWGKESGTVTRTDLDIILSLWRGQWFRHEQGTKWRWGSHLVWHTWTRGDCQLGSFRLVGLSRGVFLCGGRSGSGQNRKSRFYRPTCGPCRSTGVIFFPWPLSCCHGIQRYLFLRPISFRFDQLQNLLAHYISTKIIKISCILKKF